VCPESSSWRRIQVRGMGKAGNSTKQRFKIPKNVGKTEDFMIIKKDEVLLNEFI
jgi:hypothetical protein